MYVINSIRDKIYLVQSSLWAEGYGMLAATMFMALVGIYTGRKDIRLL